MTHRQLLTCYLATPSDAVHVEIDGIFHPVQHIRQFLQAKIKAMPELHIFPFRILS